MTRVGDDDVVILVHAKTLGSFTVVRSAARLSLELAFCAPLALTTVRILPSGPTTRKRTSSAFQDEHAPAGSPPRRAHHERRVLRQRAVLGFAFRFRCQRRPYVAGGEVNDVDALNSAM